MRALIIKDSRPEGRLMARVVGNAGFTVSEAGSAEEAQDILKGRRTEIDYLNGFVAAEGRGAGVPTPFNDAVVAAFHAHVVGALRPDLRNLDPLVRLLP